MQWSGTVRAAAVQLSPVLGSATGTADKVLEALRAAAREGAQLVVFPETTVPYYPYFSFITPAATMGAEHLKLYERAVAVPGPVTTAVSAAARELGLVVVLGVNERDHGTLYNTQLLFNADGRLVHKRRKITPTYHERMVWGQGDGSGLKPTDTAVGRVGMLACWEHYNPLARYALMAQHEQIHCSQFPGSLVGPIFAEQMEVTMRHHALESGCFVINSTAWLDEAQVREIAGDSGLDKAIRGGCYTAIVSPEGRHLAEPLREGEGMVLAELDLALITKRKRMMDSVGHYARPELLSLLLDSRPAAPIHAAGTPADVQRTFPDEQTPADTESGPVDRDPVARTAPA